jgi:membrane protein involved in D-alanine export
MTPFADWTFFGVLLIYAALPVCVLGLLGKASPRRSFIASLLVLGFIYSSQSSAVLRITGLSLPAPGGPELLRPWEQQGRATQFAPFYVFLASALWQWLLCFAFVRWKTKATFYGAITLALTPLFASKFLPYFAVENAFGFLGISYVTFRALDVVFSIHDGAVKSLAPGQLFAFLFFFPTVSSGPIDRYRRFGVDWAKERTRAEFLDDLDFAIQRVMRGFLYKFIIAALIDQHLETPLEKTAGFWGTFGAMYSYTLYLFFDFAGYSAFAVGISRLLGIRTPENFDAPFLARNIREFWARWHQSLSFWLRDHVHMRFQLAAAKGKWFKGKTTAGTIGTFLTFGIMGVWHGLALHYIIYGMYHAVLVTAYDSFARWNKRTKRVADSPRNRWLARLVTFHIVAFGMLIFSGRLIPPPPPAHEEKVETVDSRFVEGYVWRRDKPDGGLEVDVYIDWKWALRVPANITREDLKERAYGSGRHGFRADISPWFRDGMSHSVEVRLVGSNQPVGKVKKIAP